MADKDTRGSSSSSSDAQKPSVTPGSGSRGSSVPNKSHDKEARNTPDASDVINNNSKPAKDTRAPIEKSDREPARNSADRANKENKEKKNNSTANNIGNNSKGNNVSSANGSGSKNFLNKRSADNFLDKAAGSESCPIESLPDQPIKSLPAATGTTKHSGRGSGGSTSAESSDSGQDGSREMPHSGPSGGKINKHPGESCIQELVNFNHK